MGKTCIYCGKPLGKKPCSLWVGKDRKEEVLCCSIQCCSDTQHFIEWDRKYRLISYIIIAVCAAVNLLVIGNGMDPWWSCLPTGAIGLCLAVWPFAFMHYHTYERYGIVKTLKYVRIAGGGIAALGIIFTLFCLQV